MDIRTIFLFTLFSSLIFLFPDELFCQKLMRRNFPGPPTERIRGSYANSFRYLFAWECSPRLGAGLPNPRSARAGNVTVSPSGEYDAYEEQVTERDGSKRLTISVAFVEHGFKKKIAYQRDKDFSDWVISSKLWFNKEETFLAVELPTLYSEDWTIVILSIPNCKVVQEVTPFKCEPFLDGSSEPFLKNIWFLSETTLLGVYNYYRLGLHHSCMLYIN